MPALSLDVRTRSRPGPEDPTPGPGSSRGRPRPGAARAVRWLAAAVALAAACVWLYVVAVHADSSVVTSDGATVVLQGRAMAAGHLLLRGWNLSLDSWWSIDVPFYAVATALDGVRPLLLLLVPAVIAGLTVAAGVVLARDRRPWRQPAALAGAAVVLGVLALPDHELANLFICSPIHVSTTLFALVAFIGLRRNRFGLGWVVAVLAFAAGLLGDLQMALYGVVPAILAGGVASARRRSLRAGALPAGAGLASIGLAVVVRGLVDLVGGFTIGPANSMASLSEIASNLASLPSYLGQ
ncbi:MAG TPA: hypothetical protein VKV25_01095, partial [Acidimicrobiales bacterium]|nr:hypothetical protein [Acidimicrobiales bacterium]